MTNCTEFGEHCRADLPWTRRPTETVFVSVSITHAPKSSPARSPPDPVADWPPEKQQRTRPGSVSFACGIPGSVSPLFAQVALVAPLLPTRRQRSPALPTARVANSGKPGAAAEPTNNHRLLEMKSAGEIDNLV